MLASLLPSYDGFIMNYNMNGMEKSANELFAMLKTTEAGMQKNKIVLMVNKTTSLKKKGNLVRLSLRRRTRAEPLKRLNVSTARRRDTRSVTARSIWRIRRTVILVKV